MTQNKKLNTGDHSRDSAGLRYVYPVVSRRAGGVSIGINLNPNNACNWRCVYCQVPDLKRGSAPIIDKTILEHELRTFLDDVLRSDFYDRYDVQVQYRTLRDIAISGNGEPTSAESFDEIIHLIESVMAGYQLVGKLKLVLITNGSLIQQRSVQEGLKQLAKLGGEIWFKIDRATDTGLKCINNAAISAARVRENLKISTAICRTWVQTCVFNFNGEIMSSQERSAYLHLLDEIGKGENLFKGVLLYSLARPSQQPEFSRLAAVESGWMLDFAEEIRNLGVEVRISS